MVFLLSRVVLPLARLIFCVLCACTLVSTPAGEKKNQISTASILLTSRILLTTSHGTPRTAGMGVGNCQKRSFWLCLTLARTRSLSESLQYSTRMGTERLTSRVSALSLTPHAHPQPWPRSWMSHDTRCNRPPYATEYVSLYPLSVYALVFYV